MEAGNAIRGLTHRWIGPHQAQGPLVSRVLAARGLTDPAACEAFLRPSLKHLHDPSGIPDLDRASERILAAATRGERIVIFGDYDVDGVTATAILYRTIRALEPGAQVDTFIPHRDDGYGLSVEAIRELAAGGAQLIVSVDCGITAHAPASAARELGVDLIVTDHHNPPASDDDLPDAFAVVHPRRPGSTYPFGELCGAGVAFKLAWRLATMHAGSARVSDSMRALLVELLAPAALGAIADIVPLVGENRVIAKFGLPRVESSSFIGLRALVDACGLGDKRIDAEDVGFRLGPRINAVGRMGHAREALALMLTSDEDEARRIAQLLSSENERRRTVEKRVVEQACAMIEEMGLDGRRSIVLAHPEWTRGVVGLAASRLAEKYCRPTVLMRLEDGVASGSARSIEGFNLHAGLAACASCLRSFGGHDAAAGLSVEEAEIDRFGEAFEAHAKEKLSEDDLVPTIRLDCEARLDELTADGVGQIESLAPFGAENPRVRSLVRGVRVTGTQVLGRDGKHVKVTMSSGDQVMRFVGWGWAARMDEFARGRVLDVVVSPKLNKWNGRVSVEPELLDVKGA